MGFSENPSFIEAITNLCAATTEMFQEISSTLRQERTHAKLSEYEIKRWRESVKEALKKLPPDSDDWHRLNDMIDSLDTMYADRFGT